MNKTSVFELVKNTLHLQEVDRIDDGYSTRVVTISPFFTNQVQMQNYTSKILKVWFVNGFSVMLDADAPADKILQQIVTFIAENTKMFYFEPKILSWGFNCNLSYVEALRKALAE